MPKAKKATKKTTRRCNNCGRKLSPHRSVPVCPRCVSELKDRRF